MKKIFLSLVTLQIVIIIYLANLIYQKNRNVLGEVSINLINKNLVIFSQDENLKNFYEPRPNTVEEIHKNWLAYVSRYTINTDTLNERFNYQIKKPENIFRIITLGDSFTFGVNVSTEKNWSELLEDYLNNNKLCPKIDKYEVINLGVGGYDSAYEIERYRKRGSKYNPDLIIWYITDLYRLTDKIVNLTKKSKINEDEYEKRGIFFEAWRQAQESIKNELGADKLIDFNLSLIKDFIKKDLKKSSLLFISPWQELNKLISDNIYYSGTVIYGDKKSLLPDYHFNELGHQNFMNELVTALKDNKLLPCD